MPAEEPPPSQPVPAFAPSLHQRWEHGPGDTTRQGGSRQGWLQPHAPFQHGGKPLPTSLCPLRQRGDAGWLCREAGSSRSRSHSYAWGYQARKLVQAWPWATGWRLAEHLSDFVTSISLLSKHLLCLCRDANTRPAFRFSAVRFSTTHEHMVQFSQTTLHPWLVWY